MATVIGEKTRPHRPGAVREVDADELRFQQVKVSIHEELVDSLELSLMAQANRATMENRVSTVAEEICRERKAELDGIDVERMLREIDHEVFGVGPIEPLMHDESISDILVNNAYEVFIERRGLLEETDIIFADDAHLMRIIQRVASRIGRRIDEVSPMVDARLPDGSRVNACVPPLALDGPTLSIRRFGADPLGIEDLIKLGSIPAEVVDFLAAATEARISFLISGGTGSGKTTLLNAMTKFIPQNERIITIEDSAELLLQHRHVIRLETRPANTEGSGEITQRALVRNSLRMRPDRILVGEVRGAEALDMLQAMNTGHEGSLTTIHANDTRDALNRLEMMVAMTGYDLPVPVVRQYIGAGINLVVQLARLKGGLRRAMRVSEIVEVKDGQYRVEDIFGFKQSGVDDDGVATGEFYATGYVPKCLEHLTSSGTRLPEEMFKQRTI